MTDAEDLARAFFSNAEINELAQMPQALKLRAFFNGWTRKEAFVKAIGLGFSYPFNRFSVSLAADKPVALLEVVDDPEALKKWSLISLEVAPDVSAALVFEGKPSRVKFFEWNPPSLD
jgi:4'-phosphopantetheinyl transferase